MEGIGKEHDWKVVLGGQSSNILRAVSNYHRPIVEAHRRSLMAPIGEGTWNLTTEGNEKVIISGSFLVRLVLFLIALSTGKGTKHLKPMTAKPLIMTTSVVSPLWEQETTMFGLSQSVTRHLKFRIQVMVPPK